MRVQTLLDLLDLKARQHGMTRGAIALAWLLKHPAHIVPIVGSVNPSRIRDLVRADDLELSREDWYGILVAARMQPLP